MIRIGHIIFIIALVAGTANAEIFRRRQRCCSAVVSHGQAFKGQVTQAVPAAPVTPARPVVKNEFEIQTRIENDGITRAFVRIDDQWVAYAEILKDDDGELFWQKYSKPEDKWVPLTELQKKMARAKHRAEKLERQLETKRNDPNASFQIAKQSAAFQRFKAAYGPNLPIGLPSREEIIKKAGFTLSPRGAHTVVSPVDSLRPGVVITADEAHYEEVDATVAKLRGATTATLLSRNMFRRKKSDVENMRANSFIVVKPGDAFEQGLAHATSALKTVPDHVAAHAVARAEQMTGRGPFSSATHRVERAAQGGLGRREFNSGMNAGFGEAIASANEAVRDTVELIAQKAKSTALAGAARMEARAIEVEKPTDLLGFEVDFLNQKPMGVEYTLTTENGKHYFIRHLGKNYADPNGPFVPATIYGRFNVSMLEAYEKYGKITESELRRVAEMYQFKIKESGELTFFGSTEEKSP